MPVRNISSSAWVKIFKPNPQASMRLFCLPYAGGCASIFRQWVNHLPAQIELCSIQLPGREDRREETPLTHITPVVEQLLQAVSPYLDLPFAIFGHSMGALIGFEWVRLLRAQQSTAPVHLFVSGRRAPQIPDRNPQMHKLPDSEFLRELSELNGTPKQVLQNAELMQLFLPLLRADFSICGTYPYQDQPPLTCPISVFGGLADTTEPYPLLQNWNTQTCAGFSLQMFPGDHFFLQTSRSLLLTAVLQHLERKCHQQI